MSNISKYLKMNSADLEKEIQRQSKKITSCKETIALLKKLQIASKTAQQSIKAENIKLEKTAGPETEKGDDTSWLQ